MSYTINFSRLKTLWLVIVFLSLLLLVPFSTNFLAILLLYTLFLQVLIIYKHRRYNIITIFMIFLSLYYIWLIPKYIFNLNISTFYYIFNGSNDGKCLILYCLFTLGIFCTLRINNNINNRLDFQKILHNNVVIYFLNISLIIITIILEGRNEASLLNGKYGITEYNPSF